MTVGVIALGGVMIVSRLQGPSRAGLAPRPKAMDAAVYAGTVPIYPGAKYKEQMGGNYYDDLGGPVTFTSMSWWFEVKDPVDKVAEFYRAKLPTGWKPGESDSEAVSFEWVPPGAKSGEDVTVTVREGELQITEVIKAAGN
ncbi:MAG: hypothetical protein R2882_04005 [Gemmatimonadales bacterium]